MGTVFHGDIKSGNILLDKHLEPKIADFGLSRSSSKDHITMTMRSVTGTQVYTPSEYLQSEILDYTVDVHCYGVTMFDLVSGKSPITEVDFNGRTIILKNAMRHSFNDIRQFVDTRPPIQNEHVNFVRFLHQLGVECTNPARNERPVMKNVVTAIRKFFDI